MHPGPGADAPGMRAPTMSREVIASTLATGSLLQSSGKGTAHYSTRLVAASSSALTIRASYAHMGPMEARAMAKTMAVAPTSARRIGASGMDGAAECLTDLSRWARCFGGGDPTVLGTTR